MTTADLVNSINNNNRIKFNETNNIKYLIKNYTMKINDNNKLKSVVNEMNIILPLESKRNEVINNNDTTIQSNNILTANTTTIANWPPFTISNQIKLSESEQGGKNYLNENSNNNIPLNISPSSSSNSVPTNELSTIKVDVIDKDELYNGNNNNSNINEYNGIDNNSSIALLGRYLESTLSSAASTSTSQQQHQQQQNQKTHQLTTPTSPHHHHRNIIFNGATAIITTNGKRPTIIIYPTVSPESIVIPIVSSILGFPILALLVICCLRKRAKLARERDRRRNYDMQDHAVSLVRFSPIHRLNNRSPRIVSLRPERSLSRGFPSLELDTVVEERSSDPEQTQTDIVSPESPLDLIPNDFNSS